MTHLSPEDRAVRRRWINLGEFVAVAGLIISGLALWNSWGDRNDRATSGPAAPRAIPLALRGKVSDGGKRLIVTPLESGHALDSATLSANGRTVDVGSDGDIDVRDVATLLGERPDEEKGGSLPVTVAVRYVEAGEDRRGGGTYRIRYAWQKGGLFGGRELRITGWSRG